MMITHTIGQQKVLQELQDYYEYASNNETRKTWLTQYRKNLEFYYGNQWNKEMLDEMKKMGAIPLVINRIEPIIKNYVSLQINNRRRIAFRASTSSQQHAQLAEYLNNMVCNIQTQNNFQYHSTQKYVDSLIGGMGWSYFGYDKEDDSFFCDYVDPREIYWDPDDLSGRLEKSGFVCRSYYVSAITLKKRYPKFAHYFDDLTGKPPNKNSADNPSNYTDDDDSNVWVKGRSLRIVEVYYKKNEKYYEGTTLFEDSDMGEERYFRSFDREYVETRKEHGTEIKEREGTQIWKGVFCCDVLLESGALYPQVPDQKHFPLTPLILARNHKAVPYGIVDLLIDPSIALNYVWSKVIHGLDSKHLIIEKDHTFDLEKEGKDFLKQMSQKRGLISLKNAKDAQFFTSEGSIPYLFDALKRIDIEFEQITQLFDELKGNETNAISGVAIQQRTINSARNQNPLSSMYEHMLVSEGELMLDTIKGIKDFKRAFNYYKDNKVNTAVLDDEISMIDFEIYADIAPYFASSREEELGRFEGLLSHPNSALVLSSPVFLEKLGFTANDAQEINTAFMATLQSQQPQQVPPPAAV